MAKQIEPLIMWVIYEMPTAFTAVRWDVTDKEKLTGHQISGELKELRDRFESMGLFNLGRDPKDDPRIVETWL